MAGVQKSQGSTPAAASTVLDKEAREREREERIGEKEARVVESGNVVLARSIQGACAFGCVGCVEFQGLPQVDWNFARVL